MAQPEIVVYLRSGIEIVAPNDERELIAIETSGRHEGSVTLALEEDEPLFIDSRYIEKIETGP